MSISKAGCIQIVSLDANVVFYRPGFYKPIYYLTYLATDFHSFHQAHICQAHVTCRAWTWLGAYTDIPGLGRGWRPGRVSI